MGLNLNVLNLDDINSEEAPVELSEPVEVRRDLKSFQNELQNDKQASEVKVDKSVKVSDVSNMISVYSFITNNLSKLHKCEIVSATLSGAKFGEYILFKTVEEGKDSDIFLFDGCSELHMRNFVPDKISVQISGLIIDSSTQKVFVSKTNVFQFDILNNMPTTFYKFKKCSKLDRLTCETEVSVRKPAPIDMIKLKIRQICPRLFNAIKGMKSKEEIKAKLMEFVAETIDLNYLVKIYKDLLLNIDL